MATTEKVRTKEHLNEIYHAARRRRLLNLLSMRAIRDGNAEAAVKMQYESTQLHNEILAKYQIII